MNILKKRIFGTVLMYNITFVLVVLIFYFAIPVLLNYPPNSINNEFETLIDMGMKYWQQYFIIVVVTMITSNVLLFAQLKKIKILNDLDEDDINYDKLVRNCFIAPRKVIFNSRISTFTCNRYYIMANWCRYVTYN